METEFCPGQGLVTRLWFGCQPFLTTENIQTYWCTAGPENHGLCNVYCVVVHCVLSVRLTSILANNMGCKIRQGEDSKIKHGVMTGSGRSNDLVPKYQYLMT